MQTCNNFAELAKRGYYNGIIFHRIISVRTSIEQSRLTTNNGPYHSTSSQDFMVQGGDPTGTGRGGTSIYGQKLSVFNLNCSRRFKLKFCPLPRCSARMRFTRSCVSQAQAFLPWPTQGPTQTVRPHNSHWWGSASF